MNEEIPVTEARAQLSELVNRVGFGKERIVLTRHGRPLAALVPAEVLDDLEEQEQLREREEQEERRQSVPTVLDVSARSAPAEPSPYRIAAQDTRPPSA